jgi:glycosyltransferase involved in cell wall biosynthesis
MVDEEVGQLAVRPTAEALADAVTALFERDTGMIAEAARRRAAERYGWGRTFAQLSALYAELSSGFARPPPRLHLARALP